MEQKLYTTNIFCWVCFFIVVLTLGIQSVSCVFAVHSLTGPGPGGLIFERLGFSWGSLFLLDQVHTI